MSSFTKSVLEAGRQYRSSGAIAANLLRPTVYRAWERSHIQGANPYILQAEKLSELETQQLLERESTLIRAARPS